MKGPSDGIRRVLSFADLAAGQGRGTSQPRYRRSQEDYPMFGLTKLCNAVNALAESVLALSGTVAEVNGGLRRRLALGGSEGAPPAEAIDQGPGPSPCRRRAATAGSPRPERPCGLLPLRPPPRARLADLLDGCGFRLIPDLAAPPVMGWLADLRRHGKPLAPLPPGQEWFTSKEAGRLLGVKPASFRTVVGKNRLAAEGKGKARRYPSGRLPPG
jgi:hypothetical protein